MTTLQLDSERYFARCRRKSLPRPCAPASAARAARDAPRQLKSTRGVGGAV